ncbi:MAG: septum formation initiator family protein [Candidatus Doudnabacteria bacterium]|nr:septum formation initiator family protein [Candidatus Doudnabacteria bacterium]
MRQQADALQKKNDDLSQSLQYLNSPSFKERVARQQLNLKKDGEQVYGFTDGNGSSTDSQVAIKTSNAKKWWDYFFTN